MTEKTTTLNCFCPRCRPLTGTGQIGPQDTEAVRDAFDKAVAAPIAPYEPIRMRRFVFERRHDVSKTSGEGVVVEGVQFTDGKVVLKWRTAVSSIVIWDNIESAALIHGHGGDTVIRWIDPPHIEFEA